MKKKTQKRRRKEDVPRLFDEEFMYYSIFLMLASAVFLLGINN